MCSRQGLVGCRKVLWVDGVSELPVISSSGAANATQLMRIPEE